MKIFEISSEEIEKDKETSYGQEVILDIHNVPDECFRKKFIRDFAEKLCDEIGMKRGPSYVWGEEKELRTMKNPKADGISCCQFLYTSSITLHFIDELNKVFINVFSCRNFDAEKVKKYAMENLNGKIVSYHNIVRK